MPDEEIGVHCYNNNINNSNNNDGTVEVVIESSSSSPATATTSDVKVESAMVISSGIPGTVSFREGEQEGGTGGALEGQQLQQHQHKKFDTYALKVDPSQGDRANEINVFSFRRPHMRAFHFAWWSYHVAFLMWFSISPLLSEVQESLDISKKEIWTSSIAAVSGTILMRFALGPYCDKYGPRIPMGIILFCSAVPTGLTGFVNSAVGLAILRFFIGIGGSTFVMCQYWTSCMFTKEWVGTANATVGGWGNLGGAVTQLLMGSILFPLLKNAYDGNAEKAWRTACVVPCLVGLVTSYCVVKFTDDSPKGNYSKQKKMNQMGNVSMAKSFRNGTLDANTWLIFIQYACCFGVEITMNNAAALYFKEEFGQSTESAAAIASIFGWMNLFARGLGGFISDKANARFGMRGRLGWQSICLIVEGLMVITFANTAKLATSILVLVFFSIFVQAAEGSTYGIVPYINPPITGSISGIIGAGGNVGAVVFGLFFRQMSARSAFSTMGAIILSSSLLSIVVFIKGHPGLIWRTNVVPNSNNADKLNNDNIIDEPEVEEGDTQLAEISISDTTANDHVEEGQHQRQEQPNNNENE